MTHVQMVLQVLCSGEALDLWEIEARVKPLVPHTEEAPGVTGISARVRDLRKEKFGGFTVLKERIPGKAYPKYRLVLPVA